MTEPARYRLVRTIATGGMAQVLEAEAIGHDGFTRRVAFKRVLPEFAHDDAIRRMFFDEARIASRLHHGGIVQVLDYGLLDGTEFIVLEYVDGVDLSRAARQAESRDQLLPEGLAFYIIGEVAHALAYAHAKTDEEGEPLRIVHRDVSPQNILLSWDGDVKLSDFGIAIATDRREKTRTGHVKGKLQFMAPEQATGGVEVTGAADVYALGATLLRLLSGEAPPSVFERDEDGLELPYTLSEEAMMLVRSCTATDPEKRPDPAALADRAGRRAAKLLEQGGRGALRDWLSKIRPAFSQIDTLSELQDMFVVAGAGAREFSAKKGAELGVSGDGATVPARPGRLPKSAESADEARVASGSPGAAADESKSGTPWLIVAALAIAFVGAAAIYVASEPPVEPTAAPGEEASVPSEQPAAEVVVAGGPAAESPIEAPTPDEAPRTDPEPAPPQTDPAVPSRTRRTRRSAPEPDEPVVSTPPPAPASDLRGHIALPRSLGSRVRVDRREHFTPDVVSVVPGAHTIEVLGPGGEVQWRTSVSVGAEHTTASPFEVHR